MVSFCGDSPADRPAAGTQAGEDGAWPATRHTRVHWCPSTAEAWRTVPWPEPPWMRSPLGADSIQNLSCLA